MNCQNINDSKVWSNVARSKNIWIAFDRLGQTLAAWTVKHEMVNWLNHNRDLVRRIERIQDSPDVSLCSTITDCTNDNIPKGL